MKQILAALMAFMLMASLAGAESLGRSGIEPASGQTAWNQTTAQESAHQAARQAVAHSRRKRIQPFVSQQMVKPPVTPKSYAQKMRAYQMQPMRKMQSERPAMRPGRNYDNPAANRFGDGSQPNTYIQGGGNTQQP